MTTTETHREPGPDELADATDDHGTGDHGGHETGEALGPVDVAAWGALAVGVAAGLLIVLCLVITRSLL